MNVKSSLHSRESGQMLLHELDTLSLTQPDVFRQRLDALKSKHQRSEQQLQQLVATKQSELQSGIAIYDKVSARISETRQRVSQVRRNLISCQQLLHCRRDELKKLWIEGVEHKHQLQLLEAAQQLRQLPQLVVDSMRRGRLYCAVRQLSEGLQQMIEWRLDGLGALADTHAELKQLSDSLHERLANQLHVYLYDRSVRPLQDSLSRHGSSLAGGSGRSSARADRKTSLSVATASVHTLDECLTPEQLESLDVGGGENCVCPLIVVLESLVLLGRLSDTVDTVRLRMSGELLTLVSRSTQSILRRHQERQNVAGTPAIVVDGEAGREEKGDDTAMFTELITTLTEQLTAVADTHERVLTILKRSANERHMDTLILYSMDEVWQRVQQTLQTVVVDYLDADRPPAQISLTSTELSARQSTVDDSDVSTANLSSFFARKRPARVSSRELFSFAASSTTLDIAAYLQDKQRADPANRSGHGVSPSAAVISARLPVAFSAASITCVCRPLLTLASDIEQRPGQSAPCALRVFIADYIGDVLLTRLRTQGQQLVDRRLHDWQQVVDASTDSSGRWRRPVLQSTMVVYRFVLSLQRLMTALPSHCNHLLSIVCAVLVQYKESASGQLLTAMRANIPDDSSAANDGLVLSASWARDPDISRFLRELPGWQQQKRESLDSVSTAGDSSEEQSRGRRETDILAANLGDGEVSSADLITELHTLLWLAHFHESLNGLSLYVRNICDKDLRECGVPESSTQTLCQLSRDIEELADTALLVLHLELRVDCFHYLGAFFGDGSHFSPSLERCDPHSSIEQLTSRLEAAHALLQPVLSPSRLRYVFADVAPLAAHVVIAGVGRIERVNEHGVKWLLRNILSVQNCLTALCERRGTELDEARQYIQLLLLLNADSLLKQLSERGRGVFSESEYGQLVRLMHRSQPGSQSIRLHANLERLAEIMEDNS